MRTDDQPAGLLMVRKDSGINTAADLRGKTIGLITLRAFEYLFVAEYLSRAGVTERDVRWQEVAVPHAPAALEHRRVDAAWIIEPYLTVLRESGAFKGLLMAQDIAPGASMMSYVALRPWAEGRPAARRRLPARVPAPGSRPASATPAACRPRSPSTPTSRATSCSAWCCR